MSYNLDTLQITPEILSLIAEIDEFKGAWQALGTLAPERLSALRHVATIESIGSSTRIEGSKLSDIEVERLLSKLAVQTFETRDGQEVAGYAEVMELIFQSYDQIPLSANYVKQLHKDVLKYSTKDAHHRGEYKTSPNHVSAFDPDGKEIGIVFETATPFDTPRFMNDLLIWTVDTLEANKLHPLLVVSIFIVVFLEIHPFQDGNGRLSRVLTTLLLLKTGYSYVPYSSMESIIEQNKESYYIALRRTQGTIRTDHPDWQPWVQFFLQTLQNQKKRLEIKIEREQISLKTLPELSIQILEIAKQHGRITNAMITKTTGANRNTIKAHLRQLVETNQLEKHGTGKGTWYSRTSS
ncbi:MAG: Fic family protein [Pseudomonadota bacterium]